MIDKKLTCHSCVREPRRFSHIDWMDKGIFLLRQNCEIVRSTALDLFRCQTKVLISVEIANSRLRLRNVDYFSNSSWFKATLRFLTVFDDHWVWGLVRSRPRYLSLVWPESFNLWLKSLGFSVSSSLRTKVRLFLIQVLSRAWNSFQMRDFEGGSSLWWFEIACATNLRTISAMEFIVTRSQIRALSLRLESLDVWPKELQAHWSSFSAERGPLG